MGGAGRSGASFDMGRVIWATEGTAGNVLRDLFVYKLICRPHEERTVPSFWAAESADSGKQKLLPSPLLGAPGLLASPHSTCILSDFTSACILVFLQRKSPWSNFSREGRVAPLGYPLVLAVQLPKALLTTVSCLWTSLQIPSSRPIFTA